MCVARTCKRRRRQMAVDTRYRPKGVKVSRKLQGRAKLVAMQTKSKSAYLNATT